MSHDANPSPRQFLGVMVSSTFTDLIEHRAAIIKGINAQDNLKAIVMENDSAKPDGDVLDSSLEMVRKSAGYVGVISHKYGQIPDCPKRNPDGLSLTELEFNAARDLGRPVLLFIMGDGHDVKKAEVEKDPEKIQKLEAFRENAKRAKPDSTVHRVYKVFNDLHEFEVAAMQAVGELARFLEDHSPIPTQPVIKPEPAKTQADPIPKPPAFYAEPPYIGSHQFLGRNAELDKLEDWATPANPYPVLLFEAIGGTGKSILTWHWVNHEATTLRGDWAGRFWYSFYEKGAVMADFCRRALAYMTGQPMAELRKQKTLELSEQLLRQLQARPWLLVLDGLERVLVSYHRYDAAQLRDEEAGETDVIAHRDPCAAIRPEDDELLRQLAAAAPSKLLITTRLTPKILLNTASQPIPGVMRERLSGLRPPDAEALLRACGITGDGPAMQAYLQEHCDCHPLVTGVLAGLIHDYLPDRGNFDAWAKDPEGGGKLNLAELDLVQKRNNILLFSIVSLPEKSRQLLSTLALLSEAADYDTLSAFNPHLSAEVDNSSFRQGMPESSHREVNLGVDTEPESSMGATGQLPSMALDSCRAILPGTLRASANSLPANLSGIHAGMTANLNPPKRVNHDESRAKKPNPARQLAETVKDLEKRGLLQYDGHTKRYDLHPVVRGVAAGGLSQEQTETYGQWVVDYFSRQRHDPYEDAQTLGDLHDGLQVIRTLLRMGRYRQAFDAYRGDIANALFANLEAHEVHLSLLHPFFPVGWAVLPEGLDEVKAAYLANNAAGALNYSGDLQASIAAFGSGLMGYLCKSDWVAVGTSLRNLSVTFNNCNRLAGEERCLRLALALAEVTGFQEALFMVRLLRFRQLARIGKWDETEGLWALLDPMGRSLSRAAYRLGTAEYFCAGILYWYGGLQEEHLIQAEQRAKAGKNRQTIRELHRLRGAYRLDQAEWKLAADSLHEAVHLARAVGLTDASAETGLALAKFHLGQLADPRHEAKQLAKLKDPAHRTLAELWLAIGERERAVHHALEAYRWAWADGEPYVHRFELNKARALLEQLGEPIPDLPLYDPAKDEKFPWEDEVAAAIEQLRAEKAAK